MKKLWLFTMSSTSLSSSLPSIVPSIGKSSTDNHSLVDIANEFILGIITERKYLVPGLKYPTLTFSC